MVVVINVGRHREVFSFVWDLMIHANAAMMFKEFVVVGRTMKLLEIAVSVFEILEDRVYCLGIDEVRF